jgi:hypothetical protein
METKNNVNYRHDARESVMPVRQLSAYEGLECLERINLGRRLEILTAQKRNILFSTIEQRKGKIQRPLCEIFTGRREREGTSFPLSSHAQSWEADRSRMNYGMLAVRDVSNVLEDSDDATYEVVVCEVGKVSRLDTQVLEGLC